MNIPFLSLKDVTALHGDEINEAVHRVVDVGWYNNLIAWFHYSQLDICTEYPNKSIQTVSTSNAIVSTYKL